MTKGDKVVSLEQSREMEDTINGLPLQPKPSTPTQSLSQSQAKQISEDEEIDSDSDYTDHDTLGLHYDDEANKGGVLPHATASIGGISAITTPTTVPFQSIKIPKPISVLDPNMPSNLHWDPSRPGTRNIVLGGSQGSVSSGKSPTLPSTCTTQPADFNMSFNTLSSTNPTDEERIDVATKNLIAGMKALDNAAFDAAAVFFLTGREQLGEQGWDIDFKTMLKLTSEAANAAYITGDFDNMNVLIDEVLSIEGISVKDKFRVYEVKILAEQGRKMCVGCILCTSYALFIISLLIPSYPSSHHPPPPPPPHTH